jgi:hypothetical protein
MKKAKIFLTAFAVLTIAGGAVAFKAKAPKLFYQCDLSVKKCRINTTTLLANTTNLNLGNNSVPYDEFDKDCKLNDGWVWTCETFTAGE